MLICEITLPEATKTLPKLKPLPKRKPIKPRKKTLLTIKPQTASQAMIAAKKRDVETAKLALKREKEYQKRSKELEMQRKGWAKPANSKV